MNTVDLNLFIVFEVIYETGNLTRAAQSLNVTQPAVSNALARLREQMEDPLFVHADKRMNPTARADELIGPVREALRLLRGSTERRELFNPATSRKVVRLSIGDVAGALILPVFVDRLRRLAPHISLQIFQVERRSIAKMLATHELDFAVDIPMTMDRQVEQVSLTSDRQVCVCALDHPLAGETDLSLEAYLGFDHIHVSSRRRGGGVADVGLSRLGVARSIAVRLQQYQSAFAVLAKTDMLLTAPATLARIYPCRSFPLPFEAPNLDLTLYWHKSGENAAVNNWLHDVIVAAGQTGLADDPPPSQRSAGRRSSAGKLPDDAVPRR